METLCRRIAMPEEWIPLLLEADASLPALDLRGLRQEACWAEALQDLANRLAPDPDGRRMLCCMLRCAKLAEADYAALGLPDQVYTDTFGCFSRFVREHRESYGAYGFDRAFWTVRQVSCKLFRIGQLEYELTMQEGKPIISLHIPSDASLEMALLRTSWKKARTLLGAIGLEWAQAPIVCHSWLLSPVLQEVLPSSSRILEFQQSFTITPRPSSGGYVQWIYKDRRLSPDQYPEETALQRSLKAWLLQGGTFTDGFGLLSEDPFQDK